MTIDQLEEQVDELAAQVERLAQRLTDMSNELARQIGHNQDAIESVRGDVRELERAS